MRKIGLFGGSFNPIHNGHVTIGRTMLQALHLDEVWYMVSPQNPLKVNSTLLDENLRLSLVELALRDDDRLRACDLEFHLPRPSYTWTTLQALKESFPDCEFKLIIGGDNLEHFDKWAHHDEILSQYYIAVFPRTGSDISASCHHPHIHIVDVPRVDVTSTMLREMLQRGDDITPFVPCTVAEKLQKYAI